MSIIGSCIDDVVAEITCAQLTKYGSGTVGSLSARIKACECQNDLHSNPTFLYTPEQIIILLLGAASIHSARPHLDRSSLK
jgi:hypothetical protein